MGPHPVQVGVQASEDPGDRFERDRAQQLRDLDALDAEDEERHHQLQQRIWEQHGERQVSVWNDQGLPVTMGAVGGRHPLTGEATCMDLGHVGVWALICV